MKEDINNEFRKYQNKYFEKPVCRICGKPIAAAQDGEFVEQTNKRVIFLHTDCYNKEFLCK